MSLRLDWCSHEAAKYAVEHWHYSKCLPTGKLVKIGVWEDEKFIGCVIFSYGASPMIGTPYKLKQVETCELTRIALTKHDTSVSRIISISTKMLYKFCNGLRLVVSYADSQQGHHGGVYQASGWIYVGRSVAKPMLVLKNGQKRHNRLYMGKNKKPIPLGATWSEATSKFKYLMPLDAETRKNVLPLSKPYPKRPSSEASSRPSSEGSQRFNSDSRAPTLLQSTAN